MTPGCVHMHPGKCTEKEEETYIWTCCKKKENSPGCMQSHAPVTYHPGCYRYGWECCGFKERGAVGCKKGAPHHHSKPYMILQTTIAAHAVEVSRPTTKLRVKIYIANCILSIPSTSVCEMGLCWKLTGSKYRRLILSALNH